MVDRKWFQGKDGQVVPVMTPEIVESISERYIELYEQITGEGFVKPAGDVLDRVEGAIKNALAVL
jgi:phosphoribosylaminoimidazole-succinocarboxamide synthase